MVENLDVKALTQEKLAKTIDHSLLQPTVTDQGLREGCKLADKYHTATVCVKPYHVKLASELLASSDVKVSTVIGFPHGAHLSRIKALETEQAIWDGAKELDMVINIGALRSKDFDFVKEDVEAVVNAAGKHKDILVKVILENCYLSDEEKITACRLAEEAGADFVKTSTGFGTGGATPEDVRLMRKTVSPHIGIKAAGGIRSLEKALEILEAGADRIGATATIKILEAWKTRNR